MVFQKNGDGKSPPKPWFPYNVGRTRINHFCRWYILFYPQYYKSFTLGVQGTWRKPFDKIVRGLVTAIFIGALLPLIISTLEPARTSGKCGFCPEKWWNMGSESGMRIGSSTWGELSRKNGETWGVNQGTWWKHVVYSRPKAWFFTNKSWKWMSLKMGQRPIPKDQHHFPRFQKMAILGYWPSLGQAQCSLTKPAKLVCPTSFFSKKETYKTIQTPSFYYFGGF